MRKCRFCDREIAAASRVCEHCGKDLIPKVEAPAVDRSLAERAAAAVAALKEDRDREAEAQAPAPIVRASVVDIQMPFWSMVTFMVKWAIAAIPAILILIGIFVVGGLVFGTLASVAVRDRVAGITRAAPSPPPIDSNEGHARLMRAPETERIQVLTRIVTAAGRTCATPAVAFYQGASARSGDAWWNLDCVSSSYAVRVKNDAAGTTEVLSCPGAIRVSGTRCFEKMPTP